MIKLFVMITIKQNLINILREIKTITSTDNRGAFVLPFELKLKDQDFLKYCHFDVDWDIDSISAEDLPSDFSSKAVKLVDLFRRKTVNLPYECLLFFDYKTGEIIYCFVEETLEGQINNQIYESYFDNHHVASIHNHPKGFLSAPSGQNFQILEIENEDYELICGYDEFWILEAKGVFDVSVVEKIRKKACDIYFNSFSGDNNYLINELYGEFLKNYINNKIEDNIKLTKVRYH